LSGSPNRRHDDGNGGGRLLGRTGRRRAAGHDQVDGARHKPLRQIRKALGIAVGGTIVEAQVDPLDVAALAQAALEGVEIAHVLRRRHRLEQADAPDLARLRDPGAGVAIAKVPNARESASLHRVVPGL
jgi:hypothetical protein